MKDLLAKQSRLSTGYSLCLALFLLAFLSACATVGEVNLNGKSQQSSSQVWIDSVLNYQAQDSEQFPNFDPEQLFAVTDEMRDLVTDQFAGMTSHGKARSIGYWLLDEEGHNMVYDVNANLSPIEAFENRRANCLSFTLLLHSLAREMDVHIKFNQVDIPDSWSQQDDLGMIYYRHVNGILRGQGKKQIFDLAMEMYDPGYPQKYVSKDEIIAMFLNNEAMSYLHEQRYELSAHMVKQAISYAPKSSDLWVNLGVIKKRQGDLAKAEAAFLKGHALDRLSVVAASNLERLYLQQDKTNKAKKYAYQARRARLSNPYVHYGLALELYKEENYKKAARANNKAIRLHGGDPKFYELKSLIAQQQGDYRLAIKSLAKALEATNNPDQQSKYLGKAKLVAKNAQIEYEQRTQRQQVQRSQRTFYTNGLEIRR